MDRDIFQVKPTSLLHTLAEHFLRDAEDFAVRFGVLWEHGRLMHKMGRTKSFVDLLMAVECALKAHALLSLQARPVERAYCAVRLCNHDIRKLVALASYMKDRTVYKRLADQLAELQVHLRYSFEADEAFFPAWTDRADAEQNYGATIGDNSWVLAIRGDVETLIGAIQHEFTGSISGDFEQALKAEAEMRQFIDEIIKTDACRRMK
ncbi:hypothetical protein J2789_004306 [Variovorax paradoxus]|nr:hypothetical protein [Variovorax paradoxus]